MRRGAILCLAALLMLFITEAGDVNANAGKAGPARGDRGAHFTVALTGSELDAPRQTPTTDLELFTGLGLGLAGGYRFGRFRVEGELHVHRSERPFTGDSVGLRTLMVNGYVDFRLSKQFDVFLGAGVGNANVDIEFDTCLDLLGCPAFTIIDTSTSVSAFQYTIGLGYSPSSNVQYFSSYRQFQTADLGLRDSLSAPFSDDQVKMPMAVIGITRRFQKRCSTPPG